MDVLRVNNASDGEVARAIDSASEPSASVRRGLFVGATDWMAFAARTGKLA